MKTVVLSSRSKHKVLHVETPEGIINIRIGLRDLLGRPVTSVECIPDAYEGEARVILEGMSNTRMIRDERP